MHYSPLLRVVESTRAREEITAGFRWRKLGLRDVAGQFTYDWTLRSARSFLARLQLDEIVGWPKEISAEFLRILRSGLLFGADRAQGFEAAGDVQEKMRLGALE
ncbi:unnamed protein product [Prunus armeniaca]